MTYMFGDSDVVAKVKHTDWRSCKTWVAANVVTRGPTLYHFIGSSLWHFSTNIIISNNNIKYLNKNNYIIKFVNYIFLMVTYYSEILITWISWERFIPLS